MALQCAQEGKQSYEAEICQCWHSFISSAQYVYEMLLSMVLNTKLHVYVLDELDEFKVLDVFL